MVQNLLKYNSVLTCVWSREISLKSHLSDPLFFSQSSDRGNLSRQAGLIAPVRDRSGAEVEISHPWNSSQSCHDFRNSSLPCNTSQAHYFWCVTTSGFSVQYPHAAFPTHLSLGIYKTHLLFWSQGTPSRRLTKELKSCLTSGSSHGPMRVCWLCKVLSPGNNILLPLRSLWNKRLLPELGDFCCWPCGCSSSFTFLSISWAWPRKAQSPNQTCLYCQVHQLSGTPNPD